MLSVMALSAEEAFHGHTQDRREKHVKHQWREHPSLSETLPYVKLFRVLSIIRLHACLYGIVGLGDDGKISRWHDKTS